MEPARDHNESESTMSSSTAVILMFALTGFLLGGAFTTWKTNRQMSIALLVAAGLAALGAVLWLQ